MQGVHRSPLCPPPLSRCASSAIRNAAAHPPARADDPLQPSCPLSSLLHSDDRLPVATRLHSLIPSPLLLCTPAPSFPTCLAQSRPPSSSASSLPSLPVACPSVSAAASALQQRPAAPPLPSAPFPPSSVGSDSWQRRRLRPRRYWQQGRLLGVMTLGPTGRRLLAAVSRSWRPPSLRQQPRCLSPTRRRRCGFCEQARQRRPEGSERGQETQGASDGEQGPGVRGQLSRTVRRTASSNLAAGGDCRGWRGGGQRRCWLLSRGRSAPSYRRYTGPAPA